MIRGGGMGGMGGMGRHGERFLIVHYSLFIIHCLKNQLKTLVVKENDWR